MHREVLARGLDLAASELAVLVGELELAGMVRSLPGSLVVRASRQLRRPRPPGPGGQVPGA